MLAGRYPSDEFAELRPRIVWDRVEGTLRARAGARMLAVVSGGTIPDRGLYGVFTPEGSTGRRARRGDGLREPGGRDVRARGVHLAHRGDHPRPGGRHARARRARQDAVLARRRLGRPAELGRAIGAFLREVDSWTDERLAEECSPRPAGRRATCGPYLAEEREVTGGVLPTDRQIVVERFRDELGDWRVCVLSPFGGRVHAPWALAIEATGPRPARPRGPDHVERRRHRRAPARGRRGAAASTRCCSTPTRSRSWWSASWPTRPCSPSRFRENAARALLLPRRRPGSRTPLWQQRQRAADLLAVASKYGVVPDPAGDLPRVPARRLRPARPGRAAHATSGPAPVRVVSVETAAPSPFAASLAFAYVANFLYEGDAPLAERRAQALTLDREMLAELLGAEELRELIDPGALAALEAELQASTSAAGPATPTRPHDLLRRLGDLTAAELRARSTGDFAADAGRATGGPSRCGSPARPG